MSRVPGCAGWLGERQFEPIFPLLGSTLGEGGHLAPVFPLNGMYESVFHFSMRTHARYIDQ